MNTAKPAASLLLRLTLIIIVLAPIASAFYKYFFTKNYDFIIEAPCNLEIQKCFIRDCTNSEDCPPNKLSSFRKFLIAAKDFRKCKDDSCLKECVSNLITCTEIKCGEGRDDVCSIK